ncbi:MAG: HlyD family efflux transporter periplasmic adaptor subunit [Planctomycetaceae bacterium]|nr:HlyD family efflux transporter periplasmic adaptor subunit [Planctomycetaceae bacterium]
MSNDNHHDRDATVELNLQGLARTRPSASESLQRPTRSLGKVLGRALPVLVVLGMGALVVWSGRERWLPARDVTILPVVSTIAPSQKSGTPLFQSAGWIEPCPSAVKATALADGVVAEVLVVAGQSVVAGQPIAKLIDTDAQLSLRRAKAIRDLRHAELEQAQAAAAAAALRLKHPAHLQAAVAESEAALARSEIEAAKIPFLIESAQAELNFAEKLMNNRESARESLAGRLIDEARNQHETAAATWKELTQRQERLVVEQAALREQVAAGKLQLKLCVNEHQAVASSNAMVAAAKARLTEAELDVEHSLLVVERMTIRAPITGRVLERLVEPGSSLMGIDKGTRHESSTVATLYDPASLQVRADVRLEDFSKVVPDQEIRIETASSPGGLRGRVLLSTSTANIQKNTVEVKVAIIDPPEVLRPEMLVTATFLAPASKENNEAAAMVRRIVIPRELVAEVDGESRVWVVTPTQQAEHRGVQLGESQGESLIQVVAGLTLTDKLIVDGRQQLAEGVRVRTRPSDSRLIP